MRSYDEYKQILELWELGINKKAIARHTGIPRATVRDCIKRYGSVETLIERSPADSSSLHVTLLQGENEILAKAYSYVFGLYLGDGNIVKARNIYRLRITLDAKYPQIIESCTAAMQLLFPGNQIGIVETIYANRVSYVNVSVYHKQLLLLFPQHGIGHKHERKIALEEWQTQVVATYPLEFFRGLYHSDGARCSNIVNGKDYPRYQFTNTSADIVQLFCTACDRLQIHWTAKIRRPTPVSDIFIAKRKDVAFLDRWIGAKS